MLAINRTDLPIALEGEGVEVRATEAGELTAGWFSLAKGVDLGPALVGLPGDLCPCPHWGYMLKGSLRMRTANGDREYRAGEAFYWAGSRPGGAGGLRVRRLLANPGAEQGGRTHPGRRVTVVDLDDAGGLRLMA